MRKLITLFTVATLFCLQSICQSGAINFSKIDTASFEEYWTQHAAFADFDNDGDQDIIVAGTNGHDTVTNLYWNIGNDEFLLAENPVNGMEPF